ncbi:MAG: tetratricopeptide repeat protein, partial [Planctomycetota bacterium]
RATVLAKRDEPGDVEAAIEALERVLGGARGDQRLLARLHARAGRVATAIDLLTSLTDSALATIADHEAFLAFWQEELLSDDDSAFDSRAAASYDALLAIEGGAPAWLRWKLRELATRTETTVAERIEILTQAAESVTSNEPAGVAPLLRVALEEGATDAVFSYVESRGVGDSSAVVALAYALLGDKPFELNLGQQQRLQALVARFDDDADVTQAIGDYYLLSGAYEQACSAYENALQQDPNRLLAHNNLAIAYAERTGMAAEATAAISKATELEPGSPELLDTQAWLLLAEGNHPAAIAKLTSIGETRSTASSELHLAIALEEAGRVDESVTHLHRAIALGATQQAMLPREVAYVDRAKASVIDRERSAKTSVAMRPVLVENSTLPVSGGR